MADIPRIYGGQTAAIWLTYDRFTSDGRLTYGGYTADVRRIYTADIPTAKK